MITEHQIPANSNIIFDATVRLRASSANQTKEQVRQVSCAVKAAKKNSPADLADKMKSKIDSVTGKAIYAKRIATAEPPFSHICSAMGLNRFTLRGKAKVNSQWLLFCTLHNLKKIFRYESDVSITV